MGEQLLQSVHSELPVPRLSWKRVRRGANRELSGLDLPALLARALVSCLPRRMFPRLRAAVYRLCGVRVGRSTLLDGALELSGPPGSLARLSIGEECYFNCYIFLDLNAPVTIADRVTIGHHVTVVTAGHEIGEHGYRCGAHRLQPVRIGEGSWIGAGAMLLPGVTIGAGAVVAAGAVVVSDVAPDTLVGGVPARLIRTLG